MSNKMDSMSRLSTSQCTKVFIHRDFSDGTGVRFQNKFPQELEGKIDRATLERTINTINEIYGEAEALSGRTYCESCFACLTAYMAYLCMDTYYEKCLKRIARYVDEQNKTVYVPHGLMMVDPVERGLRVLEICILNDPQHR
ncbi:golgin subfamily A member 7-like isoform X1 [Pomacea canaliculata]|uniref:golgin subfamily A member 7-like isoform X1 n=2 Tax=Pomacea canaliculata TaxID=400727 RepID=UPI000D73F9C2|nr:golgin subfamily A member 7-like isoform X1 [Pomacea canaliculata]